MNEYSLAKVQELIFSSLFVSSLLINNYHFFLVFFSFGKSRKHSGQHFAPPFIHSFTNMHAWKYLFNLNRCKITNIFLFAQDNRLKFKCLI